MRVQEKVFSHAEELFEEGDTNHDGNLSSAELQELLLKARFLSPCAPSSQCHCILIMASQFLQLLRAQVAARPAGRRRSCKSKSSALHVISSIRCSG